MTKAVAPLEERKGRYACLLYDSTMKTVLGTAKNEALFIDIIELLIPGKRIKSLEMINKEHHGFVDSERSSTFDLLCTDKDTGEEFLVEVQNAKEETYQERMLYYSYFPIREQMAKKAVEVSLSGEGKKMDYSLKPVYVISLLNFNLEHESDDALEGGYISRYEIRNVQNSERFTSALNFVFLEMGRLPFVQGEQDKCRTRLERFVYTLKYMHTFTEFPTQFMEDPLLGKLARAAELANLPVERLNQYEKDMITELDRQLQLEYARKEGAAEAAAKATAAATAETTANNVKALLKAGFEAEKIADALGLPLEMVERLRD